ncbi:enoyl-CoA hydratase-related protein [Salipiger sp. P9]|uniref:enoyl-CoA hydratase-related protein n=1 Tax=Salipiger pentaromativorans TaxID=2943193 RepID=UPI0021570EF6|nr:enoyl-CoA hydratase-related protein [Salipiger pentaromativorans]MCR8550290.1 enoyl-CoA hydratase-related protein [Salipiger pentaromativorans]
MAEARDAVEYSLQDGVVWLAVASALTPAVRKEVMTALDRAAEDAGARAVVIQGQGAGFPAGADLAEPGTALPGPTISDLCARIEAFALPVVAALHGLVPGGGLEIALAAHYRVAHGAARLGFPEVKLGLIPGAGGTQRVPRMIGAGAALDMMLGGAMIPVGRPPARGLVDVVVEGDLRAGTEAFVAALLAEGKGPRRSSEMRQGFADAVGYQQEVARRRSSLAQQPELAPREIVAAVEAAMLLPFEAGLAFESDAYETCLGSDQSRALRGVFLAERRAPRFGVPATVPLPDLKRVTVLGGGPLAAQIVFAALNAGLGVNWGTRDPVRLRSGVPQVRDAFRQRVARGGLTEAQVQERMALLRVGDSAEMTGESDMILHAARGQGNVPAPHDVVRAVAFPGRVEALGLRFAQPVYSARLIEVISGPSVTPEQLAAALALARALGKVAVRVRSTGKSLGGRLMVACQRAADALVDAGQDPYEIDRAFRDWGWSRPPFQSRDQIGLNDFAEQPRAEGAQNWSALLVEQGRTGRAAGKGVYDWSSDPGHPGEDAALRALVEGVRAPAAPMPHDLIRKLVLGAMANEGLRMLSSGMAVRSSDIDLVSVLALDLPRWRGGPMHLAGVMGLLSVRRALEGFDHPDRAFWTPEPQFAEQIKNGGGFDDLTG